MTVAVLARAATALLLVLMRLVAAVAAGFSTAVLWG